MFAYLDASDNVVATSVTEMTLAEAQALVPSITTIIANAPSELVAVGEESEATPYHHRKVSGDGTDISHYEAANTYVYSVEDDTLNGVVDIGRIREEIEASAIATTLERVKRKRDDLTVVFAATLSSGDETILDGVVAAHAGEVLREWVVVVVDPAMDAIDAGVSRVVANDRPAIEVVTGTTGFAALPGVWPLEQDDAAELRVTMKFILKATGTGSNVRLAARCKFQGVGDDSSATWDETGFAAVAVTHTTLGEVFEGTVTLDASAAEQHDAIALHVGRDGANTLGAGTNDDVDQAIQIIAFEVEGR